MEVTKKQEGKILHVELTGALEETFDFQKIIGPPPTELIVNCKGISRINSAGVKSWIGYFTLCKNKGTKVTLIECSIPVVEQINMIANFACGAHIKSIYVPFFCPGCKRQLMALFGIDDLVKKNMELPNIQCPQCAKAVQFDDQVEEYFGYFMQNK